MFRLITLTLILIIGGEISLYLHGVAETSYNLFPSTMWDTFLYSLIGVVLALDSVKFIKSIRQIKIKELTFGIIFIALSIVQLTCPIYSPLLVSMLGVTLIIGAYLITSSLTTKK